MAEGLQVEGPGTGGDGCAFFAPGKAAETEDLERGSFEEDGMGVEEGLLGLSAAEGGRERR